MCAQARVCERLCVQIFSFVMGRENSATTWAMNPKSYGQLLKAHCDLYARQEEELKTMIIVFFFQGSLWELLSLLRVSSAFLRVPTFFLKSLLPLHKIENFAISLLCTYSHIRADMAFCVGDTERSQSTLSVQHRQQSTLFFLGKYGKKTLQDQAMPHTMELIWK